MTKEEAIGYLFGLYVVAHDGNEYEHGLNKALDMAIEALSRSGDLISRADAIEAVCGVVIDEFDVSPTRGYEVAEKALSALPLAEAVSREAYEAIKKHAEALEGLSIEDRVRIMFDSIDNDYLDGISDAITTVFCDVPSADAKPTVIQSKTLFPTKDFMEWAKRIKEVNPNAVVIPCDAEVASAEAVQGWIPCSERLPDVGRAVLASGYYNDVYIAELKEDKREEYYWSAFGGFPVMFSAVDAWMPLPTPYKGGDE